MSTVTDFVRCQQCTYPEAAYTYYCRSAEWVLRCPRCGYREEWKHASYFSNGHLQTGIQTLSYSAGACCAQDAKTGIRCVHSVSEAQLEEVAARMRDDIESGKLSSESYLTQYNFLTGEVTALVGKFRAPHVDHDTGPTNDYSPSGKAADTGKVAALRWEFRRDGT